jgi:hypothetical protein
MGDTEIQHQRHRTRLIHKVFHELDVPTILTPTFNELLCFNLIRCEEKVSNLINHPVVCLFGTRVGGTRVKVVTLGGLIEISYNHKLREDSPQ